MSGVPRRLLGSLALAFGALGLTLGLGEVGFRLAGYSALADLYSKPSLFWVHDELLGWSHEPGAEGRYVGPRPFPIEFETPVRINSMGLRGPEIGPRKPGELRVLVLGDSLTVGFEVPYEETFCARLEPLLSDELGRPVRVINAAVRGYGTDQQYLYYRERGRALEPDLVLLQYSANDPEDNITLHRMRRPFGKPALAPRPDGSLELVGHPVPVYPLCSGWRLGAALEPERVDGALNRALCFAQTRAADHSALFSFVSRALGRMPFLVVRLKELVYPDARGEWEGAGRLPGPRPRLAGLPGAGLPDRSDLERTVTRAILLELGRTVRGDGAGFSVFISRRRLAWLGYEQLRGEMDFLFARLPDQIDPSRIRFRNDAHLNDWGHELVAKGLVRGLARVLRRQLAQRVSSDPQRFARREEP